VVIHGCKDGSLHRMAINHFVTNEETTEAKTEVIKSPIETKSIPKTLKKKKRKISEKERQRRREAMMAILQRKRERKAQEAV
jgi:hypothetical protein